MSIIGANPTNTSNPYISAFSDVESPEGYQRMPITRGENGGFDVIGFFGRLLGPPRGEFQKFMRTAYPMMQRQAQATGLPVDCFWFMDVVRVWPNGEFGVTVPQTNIQNAIDHWNMLAASESFYVMDCGVNAKIPITGDIPGCVFRLYGKGLMPKLTSDVKTDIADFNRDGYASNVGTSNNKSSAVNVATPGTVQEKVEGNQMVMLGIGAIVLLMLLKGR